MLSGMPGGAGPGATRGRGPQGKTGAGRRGVTSVVSRCAVAAVLAAGLLLPAAAPAMTSDSTEAFTGVTTSKTASAAKATPIPAALVAPLLAKDQVAGLVPYARFVASSRAGELQVATVDTSGYWAAATDDAHHVLAARIPAPGTETAKQPSVFDLPAFLRDNGAVVLDRPAPASAASSGSPWGMLILPLGMVGVALLLYGGFWAFGRLRRRGGAGGGSGSGAMTKHNKVRAGARVTPPSTRFSDVAGVDEAVEELAETVEFLTQPMRFAATGARMPRGIILHGPPGTGKTLLARAVAWEAGVPFYAVSGSEFVESYVGVGASRVRDLFATARKHKEGAVVFIDEIDAIGRKRGGSMNGGDSEREATLNQILVELDGFGDSERIIVMAATNRLELLDDALLRPGRFDRHVQVSLPAEKGRRSILDVHGHGKPIEDPTHLDHVASVTAGFSGADLAKLLNEAAIMAARESRRVITRADLTEGMLRAVAGPEKKDRALAKGELEKIAWHEAGHALAAEICPTHVKVQQVTILARGQAAGLALYGDTDSSLSSPQELHERMVVAMAGRAAEQLRFREISSGAANDLEVVNRMARTAVTRLGFSPRVGQIVAAVDGQPVELSEETKQLIDAEVKAMVDTAYDEALALLTRQRHELKALALALLEHEQLGREEVEAVLAAAGGHEGARTPRVVHALPTDRVRAPVEQPRPVPVAAIAPEPEESRGRERTIHLRLPRIPVMPARRPGVARMLRSRQRVRRSV